MTPPVLLKNLRILAAERAKTGKKEQEVHPGVHLCATAIVTETAATKSGRARGARPSWIGSRPARAPIRYLGSVLVVVCTVVVMLVLPVDLQLIVVEVVAASSCRSPSRDDRHREPRRGAPMLGRGRRERMPYRQR